jgi:hypothetical protein
VEFASFEFTHCLSAGSLGVQVWFVDLQFVVPNARQIHSSESLYPDPTKVPNPSLVLYAASRSNLNDPAFEFSPVIFEVNSSAGLESNSVSELHR